MKCQKCGNYEANTHITEIINGIKNEIYLCNNCAESASNSAEFESIFKSGFDNFFEPFWKSHNMGHIRPAVQKICKNCQSTISDIQNSGRLGCSECYKVFKDLLLPPLKNIHGNTQHLGKAPKKTSSYSQAEQLKQELSKAVESQNFEKAAELRDKIRELEA